ncbi:MAG: hypothetical protein K6G26_11315, partial [Lachnospiraceae bacterium]|nr:hypothetical protein [Lachnospiraceae bacterium]
MRKLLESKKAKIVAGSVIAVLLVVVVAVVLKGKVFSKNNITSEKDNDSQNTKEISKEEEEKILSSHLDNMVKGSTDEYRKIECPFMVNGEEVEMNRDDFRMGIYCYVTAPQDVNEIYRPFDCCHITEKKENKKRFVGDEEDFSKPFRTDFDVILRDDECNITGGIHTEGNIDICCKKIYNEKVIYLYSNCNIYIECEEFNFKGLIIAPSGKVVINSKKVNIEGAIISNDVRTNAEEFNIKTSESSNNICRYISNYRKDYYEFDASEGDNSLSIYRNYDAKKTNVYLRYDNEPECIYAGSIVAINQIMYNIDTSFSKSLDVLIEIETKTGEKIKSKYCVTLGHGKHSYIDT